MNLITLRSILSLGLAIQMAGAPLFAAQAPFYRGWASQLDHLERCQQRYGQITAQTPSVWGRARLTQHQEEYEREMAARLNAFELTLHGARSVTDQQSFAFGLGIGAGLSGSLPAISNPEVRINSNDVKVPTNHGDLLNQLSNIARVPIQYNALPGFGGAPIGLEPTEELNQRARYINHLQELRRINEADDTADAPGYAMYLFRMPVSVIPGSSTKKGYGAEIGVTASLEVDKDFLVKTFRQWVINDLVEQLLPSIRALNREQWLKLKTNVAARSTSPLDAVKKPEPEKLAAIKELLERDLHLASPRDLARMLEEASFRSNLVTQVRDARIIVPEDLKNRLLDRMRAQELRIANLRSFSLSDADPSEKSNQMLMMDSELIGLAAPEAENYLESVVAWNSLPNAARTNLISLSPTNNVWNGRAILQSAGQVTNREARSTIETNIQGRFVSQVLSNLSGYSSRFGAEASNIGNLLTQPTLTTNDLSKLLESLTAMSMFSSDELRTIEGTLRQTRFPGALVSEISNELAAKRASIESGATGAEAAKAQINAQTQKDQSTSTTSSANDGLSFPREDIFDIYGTAELVNIALAFHPSNDIPAKLAIREDLIRKAGAAFDFIRGQERDKLNLGVFTNLPSLIAKRSFNCETQSVKILRTLFAFTPANCSSVEDVVRLLAWPVLVQMLVLDDRLKVETKRLWQHCHHPDDCKTLTEPSFYSADPSQWTMCLFGKLVEERWPLHVFALDPVSQDQNISDTLGIRRSLQVAIAASIATGKINASQASKYIKEFSQDFQAVWLNRTTAAFSQGRDKFGWRFYPRYQTRQKLRDYEIDPGMRECVAMLILPSFAPSVKLETRARWFNLEKPNRTEPSLQKLYDLSNKYQDFIDGGNKNTLNMMPEDRAKFLALLQSYSGIFPLQNMSVRVPFDNSFGGSQLVRDGVSSLAPEIYGSHGTAVLDTNRLSSVFLLGNNFNIRGTSIIAGGVHITNFTLVSRKLIELRLPAGVHVENNKVKVHVATPYGVSNVEEIPVAKVVRSDTPERQSGYHWENPNVRAALDFAPDGKISNLSLISGSPTIGAPANQMFAPANGSLALKFYVVTNQTAKHYLSYQGQEILRLSGGRRVELIPELGGRFTNVWHEIGRFLKGAIPHTLVPPQIRAEGIFRPDGHGEVLLDNEMMIRIDRQN